MQLCKMDLFKMVYGQPYLSLCIEHAAQVAPCHCKVGLSLYGFQVTSLRWVHSEKPQDRRRRGRMGEVQCVEWGRKEDFKIKKQKIESKSKEKNKNKQGRKNKISDCSPSQQKVSLQHGPRVCTSLPR